MYSIISLKYKASNCVAAIEQKKSNGGEVKKLRKITYDSHIENLRRKSLRLYTKLEGSVFDRLNHTRKPRNPEEDLVLFLLDRRRWVEALKSGRIEKIAPRRYRWNG